MADIEETYCLEPDFRSVDRIRKSVIAGMSRWQVKGVSERSVSDFCQAVCELLNNAVEHGGCSLIEAKLLLDGGVARFVLVTDGIRFDTSATIATMPEIDEQGELPEGGFGLAIIRKLSDEVSYRFVDGKNVTELSKKFEEAVHGTQN